MLYGAREGVRPPRSSRKSRDRNAWSGLQAMCGRASVREPRGRLRISPLVMARNCQARYGVREQLRGDGIQSDAVTWVTSEIVHRVA